MDDKILKNQLEVAQLVDEAAMDLDQARFEELGSLFSEDACLHIYEGGQLLYDLQGKPAILAHVQERMGKLDLAFHNNGTRMIEMQNFNQAAISVTHCITRLIQKDPRATIDQFQRFTDKLIRFNDNWYIVDRTVDILSRSVM